MLLSVNRLSSNRILTLRSLYLWCNGSLFDFHIECSLLTGTFIGEMVYKRSLKLTHGTLFYLLTLIYMHIMHYK